MLRVEVAKPNYLDRLKAEWDGTAPKPKPKRKPKPVADGEEEEEEPWNGIPLPLDTSKPLKLVVPIRRKKTKVCGCPRARVC